MRISVVGLGPGPLDWVPPAALARLRLPGARAFVRTRFFPNLERVLEGVEWQSFDDLYERSESLADVEMAMAERLLAAGSIETPTHDSVVPEIADPEAAADREVVLAVPGDGILGEAIVARLRDAGAKIVVVPGVPLGVGALAAAGLAAADGAQMVGAAYPGGNWI